MAAPRTGTEIVLQEDKQYYPEAERIYPGAEVLVMEEDIQPLTEPIVSPPKGRDFDMVDKDHRQVISPEYLEGLLGNPELIRNVAVVGHLHHGKTALLDMFVADTHGIALDTKGYRHYTDSRQDERDRALSLKAKPLTLVVQDCRDKSYLMNVIDTPGHPNFYDEVVAALRLADGVLVVMDAVEGVMMNTEKVLKQAIMEGLGIVLVINKIDRLALELRLPPNDAYHKIKHMLDEVNSIIDANAHFSRNTGIEPKRLSPTEGNVIFATSEFGGCFSLESYARLYAETHKVKMPVRELAKFFWGDVYFNYETRKFQPKPAGTSSNRTFVEFILEPFYKIVGQAISEEKKDLEQTLSKVGLYLKKKEYKLDTKQLLRIIVQKMYGSTSCIVDAVAAFVPSARAGNVTKFKRNYTGALDSEQAKDILRSDAKGLLYLNVTKLYHKPDCLSFYAFGRVLSGTLTKGMNVRILGENYNTLEQEDVTIKEVGEIFLYQSRYTSRINKALPGNWVLIDGIDQSIVKTATITAAEGEQLVDIMRPLYFCTEPVMKVACEPLNPSELPKMLEGLRKIAKSYVMAKTRVEETGEHLVVGTGELYLDCIFHDLRKLYADIEVKVSDPSVTFCETVTDTSSIKCYAESTNKKNKLTMIAEPLDKGLALDIENEEIKIDWDSKKLYDHLEKKYGWDTLTARSLWAFGPTKLGTNAIVDYTLPSMIDKKALYSIKDSVVQGFQWAAREGPLCEEPIRNAKFKVLDAIVAGVPCIVSLINF
ncbi:MAG: 116 kDa U5 small nuclear ribonucleoprotein component [Acidobacteriaceae bacterium]|nr:116 kDa U5 small nuclear ribonucleoprotein component [Acidobacteriaceae bacterium]